MASTHWLLGRSSDLKRQTISSAMKRVRSAGRKELTRFATEAQVLTGTPALHYHQICTIRTPLFWEVDSQRGSAS